MRLVFNTHQSEKAVFSFTCNLTATPQEKNVLAHYRLLHRPVIEGADHSLMAHFYIATFRPVFKAIKLNRIFDALLISTKILTLKRFIEPKGWTFASSNIDEVLQKMEAIKGSIQNITDAVNTMLTFGNEEQDDENSLNGAEYIEFPLAIPQQITDHTDEIEETPSIQLG